MKKGILLFFVICLCGSMFLLSGAAEERIPETIVSGYYEYSVLEDGTAKVLGYFGSEEDLTVANQLDGHPVTSISDSFYEQTFITSIIIPDSITSIESNPFGSWPFLQKIEVSPENQYFTVIDDVLFTKEDKKLICYPCGLTAETYRIPDGTAAIGDYAFSNCTSLSSVTVPDSVTVIGNNPFRGIWDCTVNVSPENRYFAVTDGVLFSKADMRLIYRPNGWGEPAPYEIPDGIKIIGDYAFCNNYLMTSVTIPASVTDIGNGAFFGCTDLISVTIPEGVITVGDSAFESCAILESVSIPNSVTTVGDRAFCSCQFLSSITLPDGITRIGNSLCTSSGIMSFTIPDSVTAIGDYAFRDTYMHSLQIPDSVTSIGVDAFADCIIPLILIVGRDSYAAGYAEENGLIYQYVDEVCVSGDNM